MNALLKNFSEAKKLNARAIKKYGIQKENRFWEILFAALDQNIKGAQEELNAFYKYQSESDVVWLKKELEAWGIDIIK